MHYSSIPTITFFTLSILPFISTTKLQTCPLLGQQWPAPISLSTDPAFKKFTQNLTSQIDALLPTSPFNTTSFSIGIFSTSDPNLLFEYDHASKYLSNSTQGARNVTADSVFMIGSISKLVTMYLWYITQGEGKFSDPITQYIPQLLHASGQWNDLTPDWSEITVGDLAGQMAGLARDYGLADFAPSKSAILPIPPQFRPAFPKLPANEVPVCGYEGSNGSLATCTEAQYLQGVATESPIFETAYTPVYSNEAFALVGVALANIAGKSFNQIFNDSLVAPLGLKGTFASTPNGFNSLDVIPGNATFDGWNSDFGVFGPVGGFFSTTNDFAKIGRSILNYTLTSPPLTRRWLRPTSFVNSLDQGVGRPWEIFRRQVNGHTVDLYTKGGDWGAYHSLFAVVPNYNVGFSLLTAEDPPGAGGAVRTALPPIIFDALLSTLDNIARAQASTNFAGTYTSSSSNSSLTLTAVSSQGLQMTNWVNNGTAILNSKGTGLLNDLVSGIQYNILPNQLYNSSTRKVGFTSYYQQPGPPETQDNWLYYCAGWLDVDEINYGNIPLGNMVFSVDGDGRATGVELRALRTTLTRS